MPMTATQLTKNLASRQTFNQVSYYGTLAGEPVRRTTQIDSYKGKDHLFLNMQVETQYYFYLHRVWKFSIVTESAHGFQIGDIIKAKVELAKP